MLKYSFVLLLNTIFFLSTVSHAGIQSKEFDDGFNSLSECQAIDFKQAPEFPTGPQPKGVAGADLDGDGLTDILAAFQYTSVGFSVIRNLGSNQFASKIDFTLPSGSYSVESVFTSDLDQDGKIDVVLSSGLGNKMLVYRNISTGPGNINFAPRSEYITGESLYAVAFGDFDGDGSVDIAAANRGVGTVSVFRNVSAGTGTIALAPKIDYSVSSPGVLTTGDFDGDGKLDIAAGGYNSSYVRILKNTSSGTGTINFSVSGAFDIPNRATGIDTADFDGDGKLDIVVSNSDNFAVLKNTGSGSINFAPRVTFLIGGAAYGVVAADFDGDGEIDVATANIDTNSVTVSLNTGASSGTIAFASRDWDFGVGLSPYRIAALDVNSDGKKDLVTPNLVGNNVSLLVNRSSLGSVDFAGRKDYIPPRLSGATNLETADFDGDGDRDLAVSFDEIRNLFKFSVYRNDGNGHFPVRTDFPETPDNNTGIEPYYITAGDFDGDGRTDVAMVGVWYVPVIRQWVGGLRIFRNTSSGPGNISFALDGYEAVFNSPARIFVSDLDGDGKTDIIATHKQSSPSEAVMVFRNTSAGSGSISFNQSAGFMIPNTPQAQISFADLNTDGRPDIVYVVSMSANAVVRVQINSGSPGTIELTPQDISLPFTPGAAVPGDIDNDGKTDLVSSDDQKIYVLKNTSESGPVSFAPPIAFQPFFAVKPVRIADLDGDGKKDVITQNLYGQSGYNVNWRNMTVSGGTPSLVEQSAVAVGGTSAEGAIVDDLDGNGKLDIINKYKSQNGGFSILLNQTCNGNAKAPFDFDGDGKTDIGIFRSGDGSWWYSRSSDNQFRVNTFGSSTDVIAPGDFTGDGKTDISVFRPSTGFWYIMRSEDSSFFSFPFGASGDIPAPSDYDGDGKTDAAVFRPSDSTWYIRRSSDLGTSIVRFGTAEDKPVPADFDGDSKSDIAIFRPTDGSWWYLRSSDSQFRVFRFGLGTDKPVPGDYSGDRKADIAVFRPSTGEWFVQRSEDNSFYSVPFGTAGDIPTPGDYDGDGRFDTAVFRPATANWFVQRSTAGILITSFGAGGDRPIPNAFVP